MTVFTCTYARIRSHALCNRIGATPHAACVALQYDYIHTIYIYIAIIYIIVTYVGSFEPSTIHGMHCHAPATTSSHPAPSSLERNSQLIGAQFSAHWSAIFSSLELNFSYPAHWSARTVLFPDIHIHTTLPHITTTCSDSWRPAPAGVTAAAGAAAAACAFST